MDSASLGVMDTESNAPTAIARSAARFSREEQSLLLVQPGIGSVVLQRLEEVGVSSLSQLQQAGVHAVVNAVCSVTGNTGWANRRAALERALTKVLADAG